jgi:hypothetical protein
MLFCRKHFFLTIAKKIKNIWEQKAGGTTQPLKKHIGNMFAHIFDSYMLNFEGIFMYASAVL